MADLITWDPRVGSTGDDRYTYNDTFYSGSTGGYSTVPTPTEINAGSGLNQIIAEIRRQQDSYDATMMSYFTGLKATKTVMTTIRLAISDIRDNMVMNNSYTEPPAFTGDRTLTSDDIFQFRRGVGATGINISFHNRDATKSGILRRTGATYYPTTTTGILSYPPSSTNASLGQEGDNSPGLYRTYRMFLHFAIPTGITITNARLRWSYSNASYGPLQKDFIARCYFANSWGTLSGSDWSFTKDGGLQDSEVYDFTAVSFGGSFNFALDTAKIPVGGDAYIVVVSEFDEDQVTPTSTTGNRLKNTADNPSDIYLQLNY